MITHHNMLADGVHHGDGKLILATDSSIAAKDHHGWALIDKGFLAHQTIDVLGTKAVVLRHAHNVVVFAQVGFLVLLVQKPVAIAIHVALPWCLRLGTVAAEKVFAFHAVFALLAEQEAGHHGIAVGIYLAVLDHDVRVGPAWRSGHDQRREFLLRHGQQACGEHLGGHEGCFVCDDDLCVKAADRLRENVSDHMVVVASVWDVGCVVCRAAAAAAALMTPTPSPPYGSVM